MNPPSPDAPVPSYRLDDYSNPPTTSPAPSNDWPPPPTPWPPSLPPPPPPTPLESSPSPAPSIDSPAPYTSPPPPYTTPPPPYTSPPPPYTTPPPPPPPRPTSPEPSPSNGGPPGVITPLVPPPPAATPSIGVIAGTTIGSVVILVMLCVGFFIWRRMRPSVLDKDKRSSQPHTPTVEEEVALSIVPFVGLRLGPRTFTYEELELATNRFSDSNFLGEGGFGTVHKGVVHLADDEQGCSVAIKQLKSGIQDALREFETEIQIINRVHHKHLVSLVGYCVDQPRSKMILVYEFVPNKTLAFHLHGTGTTIDWKARMKIAIGTAKGLSYLHEECQPRIIHRDIKATNILLDDNFEPKVADFGLARLSLESQVMMSRIMGSFGYLAPEYAASGKLTEKSDVFSFGVVLLELITGRKPVGDTHDIFPNGSLVEWATSFFSEALENRNFEGIADERLQNDYDVEDMFRMVSCAANCVRYLATSRPRMSQVVQALEGVILLDNDLTEEKPARRQLSEDPNKLRKLAFGSYSTTPSTSTTTSGSKISTTSTSGSKISN